MKLSLSGLPAGLGFKLPHFSSSPLLQAKVQEEQVLVLPASLRMLVALSREPLFGVGGLEGPVWGFSGPCELLVLEGKGESWEGGLGECVDFALWNYAHPEPLRTA